MEARFPGRCSKCDQTFGRGVQIKPRWTFDRASAKMARVEGEWVHVECPKKYVDPETGEIVHLMQRVFDGTEVPYDEAMKESPPVGAFRARRKKLKLHPDQGLMFETVDKPVNPT